MGVGPADEVHVLNALLVRTCSCIEGVQVFDSVSRHGEMSMGVWNRTQCCCTESKYSLMVSVCWSPSYLWCWCWMVPVECVVGDEKKNVVVCWF